MNSEHRHSPFMSYQYQPSFHAYPYEHKDSSAACCLLISAPVLPWISQVLWSANRGHCICHFSEKQKLAVFSLVLGDVATWSVYPLISALVPSCSALGLELSWLDLEQWHRAKMNKVPFWPTTKRPADFMYSKSSTRKVQWLHFKELQ